MQTVAHYNLLERLGAGALGDVYRARDLKVGRTVALMMPGSERLSTPGVRAEFLEQARAAQSLNHPNIATLFDVVEEEGHCYLAYEFAAGPSLRDEMAGRSVNLRRAIELAAQISDALAEGHSRGLIHGDLRPDNIVITPKGSPKILNFGLARWTTSGQAREAAASAEGLGADPYGVAGYLSPEQALGGTIDERSDLFTFGVLVHEMLTGRNPFTGPAPAATLINIIRLTPPPPSALTPSVPAELDALVAHALAKPVEARPSGALALSSDLRRIGAALDAHERDIDLPKRTVVARESAGGLGWLVGAVMLAVLIAAWWYFGGT
jgi:eukaryotic-like serine/threonine-protein kinase